MLLTIFIVINIMRDKNWCLTGIDRHDIEVLALVTCFAMVDTVMTGTLIYYLIK